MCGFGEKDRRPVDPPPIVQLLLDEQHNQHPARRAHRSAIAAALAAAASTGKKGSSAKKKGTGAGAGAGKKTKGGKKAGAGGQEEDADEESVHGDHEDDEGDEAYQQEEGSDVDEAGGDRKSSSARNGRFQRGGVAKNPKHEHGTGSTSSPSLGKHSRQPNKSDHSNSDSDNNSDSENDNDDVGGNNGDLDEQDPLFVLHVSLWSHDGTEVRNMIATPGQSDPPKLTRILMGSLVVSPILLNNPEGVPGWYFSFPDLSIRTEGTYTLKFSLMRFGSFDFSSSEDGQTSLLVAEETSDPFQVFSAKKFPGMTESTELSKAFAKQGLKIPIRNDLRVRKADRD
ncbi:hypothetical protein EC957_004729 [Mortierella hygrophila]|uniref:Velvet domain-containing protein n=1 Tax=Mortierella hygrophila TaxID=979708 RepID=A0A9P6FFL3_9FUNG|nr:hypothetical protein EC957_004729 [Mortierella hygrophila]